MAFIGLLVEYKEWKISELKSVGFDPKDPNEMMEITIDDYKPDLFSSTSRWFKWGVLKKSAPEQGKRNPPKRFKSFEDQNIERKEGSN